MSIFEIRYYTSGNYVIEGQGYWLSSVGEFSKVNENSRTGHMDRYEDIIVRRWNEKEKRGVLHQDRELTETEHRLMATMADVLKVLTHTNPKGFDI